MQPSSTRCGRRRLLEGDRSMGYECNNAPSKGRILVIDDDDLIRGLLVDIFEQEGFEVEQANDGRAGLDRVQLRMPQLIILDLMMPHMDGYAFMAVFGSLACGDAIPIVVLSASYGLANGKRKLIGAGRIAYMSKPFDVVALLDLVRSLMGNVPAN